MSSQRAEQILRKTSDFLIYSFLEWVIIIWLYIIGLLAFLCSEFTRLVNLSPPCWLCTRIDHIFTHKDHDFYYNKSVCEAHKKDISSLAYCQVHSKLSDIKSMCDRCLLSFATERDSDIDTQKFILQKDIDAFVEEDHNILKGSDYGTAKKGCANISCSCCGEPLARNSKKSDKHPSTRATALANPSISSPRAPFSGGLPQIRTTELQPESDLQQDENKIRANKEIMPSVPDSEDPSEKTPSFIKENRFFKISLTELGASSSPRFANPSSPRFANSSSPRFANPSSPRFTNRHARKLQLEKEIFPETNDKNAANGAEGELPDLFRKETRLDRKSFVDLYMELEEERSASAEAANNAMAMITRLQAEKAAMQMEALHYQRIINEQSEYDQEALKLMQDQVKILEVDLETYREKYGPLEKEDLEEYEEGDEGYQEFEPEFDTDESYYRPTPN